MTRVLQYTAAFTSILTAICCGLHFGWPSPNLPVLLSAESLIPMTNEESSWVLITYLLGGLCGAVVTGIVLDILGRRNLLLLLSVPLFTSWILIAFANSLALLLVARFIAGVSEGVMFGTVPVYISEISDPEIRGCLGCFITIMVMTAVILANVLGSYLSIYNAALICAGVPLIFALTFVWMPETPYYLLLKGKKDQARRSLMVLKRSQNVDVYLETISDGIEKEKKVSLRFSDLFTKRYGKNLLIVMGIRATQQLSGLTGFVFYAQTIISVAGGSLSPLLSVVIFHGVQVTFSLISSLVIDRLGRRPLLIASVTGCCLPLLVEGVYFVVRDVLAVDVSHITWLPTLVLITFMISYSLGLQTMPVFIGAEIFPTSVKAYATTISNLYYYVFALCVSKFFQYTKDEFGMYVPFFTFSICCIFGLIFIICFVPETKNKSLEDIQIEQQNKI